MRQNRFMILLLAAALCTAQNGGNDLFQQGLRKERSEGDYKGAIEVYRRVLKQYASDRKLAAKALLQIAQCQERQGSKEARLSYERLIKEYGDQPQAVAEARARITAIEVPASSTPRVRQLWTGKDVDHEGSVSPDGRWLTYAHWETGDLGVRDLVNNTNKLLTNTGGWEKSGGEFAENSQFSPDGKRIVYNWFLKSGYELRVMNSDGSGVRTVGWANAPGYVFPLAWSPDGTKIVAAYFDANGLTSFHMVTLATSERRELMPPAQWRGFGATFSPDGQWIVLDGPGEERFAETDLYIIPAAGGRVERLETNPAQDTKPQWSPDGSAVLFASNRGGSFGLWRLPVRNGKASGVAQLIRGDLGADVRPIGLNRDGSLVYMVNQGGFNVYSADFDPRSVKTTTEPVPVSQRFPGKSVDPQPSPDGTQVAFIARNDPRSSVVVVRDLSTGKELVYSVAANHLQWTPDNKRLLLESTGRLPNTRELTWLDPQSGSTTPFQSISPTRTGLYPVFSKDGRTLYFTFNRWRASNPDRSIMSLDVSNGQQREIFKTDLALSGLSLSPDGKSLATMQQSKPGHASGQVYSLLLVPLTGGPERVVATGLGGMPVAGPFTPDGRRVLFSRGTTGAHEIPMRELLSVELSSGKLEPLNLVQPFMNRGTLNATGNKLYFHAGAPQNEIWIAENILPAK